MALDELDMQEVRTRARQKYQEIRNTIEQQSKARANKRALETMLRTYPEEVVAEILGRNPEMSKVIQGIVGGKDNVSRSL